MGSLNHECAKNNQKTLSANDTEQNEPKMSSLAQLEAEILFWAPGGDPLDLTGTGKDHWRSVKYVPLAKKFYLGPDNHPTKNQSWLT